MGPVPPLRGLPIRNALRLRKRALLCPFCNLDRLRADVPESRPRRGSRTTPSRSARLRDPVTRRNIQRAAARTRTQTRLPTPAAGGVSPRSTPNADRAAARHRHLQSATERPNTMRVARRRSRARRSVDAQPRGHLVEAIAGSGRRRQGAGAQPDPVAKTRKSFAVSQPAAVAIRERSETTRRDESFGKPRHLALRTVEPRRSSCDGFGQTIARWRAHDPNPAPPRAAPRGPAAPASPRCRASRPAARPPPR